MCRQFTKGSWTFSDQDHGWTVSDCTAEALKVYVMKIKTFDYAYSFCDKRIYNSSYSIVFTVTIKHATRNSRRER